MRRVQLAVACAGGLLAALAISESRGAGALMAQGQSASDVDAQTVTYRSGTATISAYLAKPTAAGKHAAVIVVHDVGGLNDAVQGVVRRLAQAGFVAIAPDLSRGRGAATIARLPLTQPVSDLRAALAFLKQDATVDADRIAALGIGWGGWRTYKLAAEPTVSRAVVFYGTTPDEGLAETHAQVLAHYAQYDFRTTGNAVWTEKELGKKFTYYVYPKAVRGFLLSTNAESAEAANVAWTRTLEFLK